MNGVRGSGWGEGEREGEGGVRRRKFEAFCNLENSAVATGLEKVSFQSDPKERQCQRMLKLPHWSLFGRLP